MVPGACAAGPRTPASTTHTDTLPALPPYPPASPPPKGSFGTVWRGLLQNKIDVAVKRGPSGGGSSAVKLTSLRAAV
jgi:hypothetical protein